MVRSSAAVVAAVWKALFLRETVRRLSEGRVAWLWILLEPIAHVLMLVTMFGFIFHRIVQGIDGAMFVMTGVLAFFFTRNAGLRAMEAINANAALYAYRQVRPIDPVLIRAAVEGFIMILASLMVLSGAELIGYDVVPHDPLLAMAAFFGMWLMGLALGLLLSVGNELLPNLTRLISFSFRPLYLLSGIMYPAIAVPQPYRDWLLFNPLLHGLETVRAAFFSQFHAAPGVTLTYLYASAVVALFFGLALHVRYSVRLATQ